MANSNEILEAVKKQLEEWKAEGVLEEKMREYGFQVKEIDSGSTNTENLE